MRLLCQSLVIVLCLANCQPNSAPEPSRSDAGNGGRSATASTIHQRVVRPVESPEQPRTVLQLPTPSPQPAQISSLEELQQQAATGNEVQALALAFAALEQRPTDEAIIDFAVTTARRLGDAKGIALSLKFRAAAYPEDATAAVREARAWMKAGDSGAAAVAAREAIRRDGGNADGWHLLARSEAASGELAAALVHFEKALELKPDSGHVLNNYGHTLLLANRNDEARQALEYAASLLPDIAYVHNNLGVAYERLGLRSEAREAYALSSALDPRYAKARMNIARIDAQVDVSTDLDGLPLTPTE